MRRAHVLVTIGLAAAATMWIGARPAEACGGFFCSQSPVDQTAEQIIFTQSDDTVTAYIQIAFQGSAEDFAWVIPVSDVPQDMDVADSQLFRDLDNLTRPVIVPPSCLQNQLFAGAEDSDGAGAPNADPRSEGGVTIYDESDVGPYETVTVGSDSAAELVQWLNNNDYIITDAMMPMIEAYLESDMLFFAMKLQVGQGVEALKPLRMSYSGHNPVIPLRLTAVAAEPNMGVLVWVLGQTRAVPANYIAAQLDDTRIVFNDFLQSNYFTLVNQIIDEAGGQAFITEFAGTTEGLVTFNEETDALIADFQYLTRMYMSISPEEMLADPVFSFNAMLPDVSNIIDLSDRDELCSDPRNPCDFNYCGVDGICHEVDGRATCECTNDTVARGISDPTAGIAIACVPQEEEMLDGIGGDPCASTTCGEFGSCNSANGTATCTCDSNYTASTGLGGGIECVPLVFTNPPQTTDPQLNQGGDSLPPGEEACSVGGQLPPSLFGLIACVGILIGLRRRKA